jgi:hypothetical protein
MRTYRAKAGPFIERPFYKPEDVEKICADELHGVDLFPSKPEPIRIERFIEKRFKITPSYEDLPEGFLGFTEFGSNGVKGIGISRLLTEEVGKVSERRINSTLAHEAGHGLLHAHLFAFGQQPRLFFGKNIDLDKPKILCRNNTIQGLRNYQQVSYDGCWWEYQANLAIGSFLLPKPLFMTSLEPFLIEKGIMGTCKFDRVRQDEAIKTVAEIFNVNPIVVKIRIENLLPNSEDKQLTL